MQCRSVIVALSGPCEVMVLSLKWLSRVRRRIESLPDELHLGVGLSVSRI